MTKEALSNLPKSDLLSVRIWRGGAEGAFVDYDVPKQASQTVLDIVTWVQRHAAPDLAYRFACRVGMCGSCAMTVNGRPRWTCRTHVDKVAKDGALTIAPLANLPVLRDLVADMAPFFEKWQRAGAVFEGQATRNDPTAAIAPDSPARQEVDAAVECINCGVCYAACDSVRWNEDYLGPAALNRVWTLQNDARDAAKPERLSKIAGAGGCQLCHSQAGCTAHCPKGLDPSGSIAGLKRAVYRAALKGEL